MCCMSHLTCHLSRDKSQVLSVKFFHLGFLIIKGSICILYGAIGLYTQSHSYPYQLKGHYKLFSLNLLLNSLNFSLDGLHFFTTFTQNSGELCKTPLKGNALWLARVVGNFSTFCNQFNTSFVWRAFFKDYLYVYNYSLFFCVWLIFFYSYTILW